MDSFIYALVLVPALQDLLPRSGIAPTTANVGYYGGLLFAVFLIGWGMALLCGPVADRFGRVRTLMLTIVCFSLFTLLSAFSTNIWTLAVLRLLAGIGIGGEWAMGATLVSEEWPEERRTMGAGMMHTGYYFGFFLAALANYFVGSRFGWRWMFVVGGTPALVVALNRLTKKQYPDSTEVDYVYDLVGKIQQVNDPTGTYAFAYDNMGRLIGATTSYSFLTGRSFTNTYSYDAASNRTGFTDPENGSTAYAHDTLNRVTSLAPPSAFRSGSFGFSYDALSRRTQMTRPNSVTTNYTYDNLSRLRPVPAQRSRRPPSQAFRRPDHAARRSKPTAVSPVADRSKKTSSASLLSGNPKAFCRFFLRQVHG